MTSALQSTQSILTQGTFDFYTVGARSITLHKDCPLEKFEEVVTQLCTLHDGARSAYELTGIMLGDVLNQAEELFDEKAFQAIDATRDHMQSLSASTLNNLQRIAKKVPAENRIEGLSTAHYGEVTRVPEDRQRAMLEWAKSESASVTELRKRVAQDYPPTQKGPPKKKGKDGKTATVIVDKNDEASMQLAAHTLAQWWEEKFQEIKDGKEEPPKEWSEDRKKRWLEPLMILEKASRRVQGR